MDRLRAAGDSLGRRKNPKNPRVETHPQIEELLQLGQLGLLKVDDNSQFLRQEMYKSFVHFSLKGIEEASRQDID